MPVNRTSRRLDFKCKTHDQHLYQHRGTANDRNIDFTNCVDKSKQRIVFSGALLIVCSTDDGDDNTEYNAQDKCQGGNHDGMSNTLQILLPAVSFDKRLIEFYIELLPERDIYAALHEFHPLGV